MSKIKQKSLVDIVFEDLKNRIINEDIKGGEKISEQQMAEILGVSRTPIREAIRRLSEYGLVNLNPRTNATVSIITKKEAIDISRVRNVLENLTISLICSSKEIDLSRAKSRADACIEALKTRDRATLFQEDSKFHLELAKATNNQTLVTHIQKTDAQVLKIRIAQSLPLDSLKKYYMQHFELLELLESSNELEADKLLYDHIFHDLKFQNE
ncbi:MAG: GntR family transcriptional regulator [Sphaerochaeta sp.]